MVIWLVGFVSNSVPEFWSCFVKCCDIIVLVNLQNCYVDEGDLPTFWRGGDLQIREFFYFWANCSFISAAGMFGTWCVFLHEKASLWRQAMEEEHIFSEALIVCIAFEFNFCQKFCFSNDRYSQSSLALPLMAEREVPLLSRFRIALQVALVTRKGDDPNAVIHCCNKSAGFKSE